MNNERYPLELAISVQDFTASGWKDAIAKLPAKDIRRCGRHCRLLRAVPLSKGKLNTARSYGCLQMPVL